jgi:hypothetical protein
LGGRRALAKGSRATAALVNNFVDKFLMRKHLSIIDK